MLLQRKENPSNKPDTVWKGVSFLNSCLHLLFLSNSFSFNHDCFLYLLCPSASGGCKSPFNALYDSFLFLFIPGWFVTRLKLFSSYISFTSVLFHSFQDAAFIILFLVWLLNWRTNLCLWCFFGTALLSQLTLAPESLHSMVGRKDDWRKNSYCMRTKSYFSLPHSLEELAKILIYWDSSCLEQIRTIGSMKEWLPGRSHQGWKVEQTRL